MEINNFLNNLEELSDISSSSTENSSSFYEEKSDLVNEMNGIEQGSDFDKDYILNLSNKINSFYNIIQIMHKEIIQSQKPNDKTNLTQFFYITSEIKKTILFRKNKHFQLIVALQCIGQSRSIQISIIDLLLFMLLFSIKPRFSNIYRQLNTIINASQITNLKYEVAITYCPDTKKLLACLNGSYNIKFFILSKNYKADLAKKITNILINLIDTAILLPFYSLDKTYDLKSLVRVKRKNKRIKNKLRSVNIITQNSQSIEKKVLVEEFHGNIEHEFDLDAFWAMGSLSVASKIDSPFQCNFRVTNRKNNQIYKKAYVSAYNEMIYLKNLLTFK